MPSSLAKRSFWRSLRFRLMVWNALVVVVTAFVTLVALREGVRITLVRELDQLLQEDLNEIEIALAAHEDAASLHEQLDRKDAGHAAHGWFAELVDRDGRVSYRSQHAPPHLAQSLRSHGFQTVDELRLLVRQVEPNDATIRVGASTKLIRADIRRLDRFVAFASAGVLVVAPLCGYWLAGRATRPLSAILATMERLRPSQLDERLAIRGTGDELDQLSARFNRLLDRFANYLQERQDILANSAHELRTPLAAIRSSVEVALGSGRTRQEYEDLLSVIIEESARLELLVNQLLLLSETENERLKIHGEPVQLDVLIRQALEMFEAAAEHRGLHLRGAALAQVTVRGNRNHLRQVVFNLLDNALKFTPAAGHVEVRLFIDDATDAAVLVVEDTGPGIPPAELPRVFERFFRGSRWRTADADRRGSGLGLSICRSIIEAHEGSIEVENREGGGTRVRIHLPRCETPLA